MAKKKQKKGKREPAEVEEGRAHKPRHPCHHLAAEFFENGQQGLGEEMLRGLREEFIPAAQFAGRRSMRRRHERVRTVKDLTISGKS